MGSPFDDVDGELRLIQYRPHQNCHLVDRFLGTEDEIDCEEVGDSETKMHVPGAGYVDAGDWVATRDGKTFEVVTADSLIDYIRGTSRTRLTA